MNRIEISKYLSFILRHKPESIGLKLDKNGWLDIDDIISKTTDYELTEEIIKDIVKNNNKQRFTINDNKIRANQGHSRIVELGLKRQQPPSILYHGTSVRFLDAINKRGVLSQERQYVHLSNNYKTAYSIGERHGKPAVLEIYAEKMHRDGIEFYISKNGIWLTKKISPEYFSQA